MKKILITLILATCIIFSSCGPGTAALYEFQSFDEFIEILDGRFLFPTYFPEEVLDNKNISIVGNYTFPRKSKAKMAYENFINFNYSVKSSINIEYKYSITYITISFYNYESSDYGEAMLRLMENFLTSIKKHENIKVYIYENFSYENTDFERINNNYINNSYLIYKDDVPYYFAFYVKINTKDETIINNLLPEINEMTYTEAMKMFGSLQPIE